MVGAMIYGATLVAQGEAEAVLVLGVAGAVLVSAAKWSAGGVRWVTVAPGRVW